MRVRVVLWLAALLVVPAVAFGWGDDAAVYADEHEEPTPTVGFGGQPTNTPSPTFSPTAAAATHTPTPTPTPTDTVEPVGTPVVPGTPTPTATGVATVSPIPSATSTATPTGTPLPCGTVDKPCVITLRLPVLNEGKGGALLAIGLLYAFIFPFVRSTTRLVLCMVMLFTMGMFVLSGMFGWLFGFAFFVIIITPLSELLSVLGGDK